jgi:hypothetical protein
MKGPCRAGGRWHSDVIRRARELGLETLVADVDPSCPGRAAGEEFVRSWACPGFGCAIIGRTLR